MTLPTDSSLIVGAGSSPFYNVTKSLRFRASASAYLSRTPASVSNRQKWTWSGWVKRGTISSSTVFILFCARTAASADYTLFCFNNDALFFTDSNGASLNSYSLYRDTSAWYHMVCAVDTTQATDTNRVLIYVNGVRVSFPATTYPALNVSTNVNTTATHLIGQNASSQYLDGYLAEVNFIDGQALTPNSFGYYDPYTGVWMPERYTGTYGTNGFYLPFSNTTSTTTLVADSSGQGNNWTPNNISLTAGATYDSMLDSPTNYYDGGNGRGNYAVLNPIGGATTSLGINSGNLQWNYTSSSNINGYATMYMPSGKWYIECMQTSGANTDLVLGFARQAFGQPSTTSLVSDAGYFGYTYAGRSWNFGTQTNGNPTLTVGTDVMNFAIDITNGKAWLGKNGTWFGSGDPATGANPWWTFTSGTAYTFAMAVFNAVGWINFGQRPFAYTPPSGYKALNTLNLIAPTISNGAQYNAAVTYTGNGTSSQTITTSSTNSGNNPLGTTFQPDFLWVKNRTSAASHILTDVIRGVANVLVSSSTSADQNLPSYITAYNSNGFSVGTSATDLNASSNSYVAWQWKAGGSTPTTGTGTGGITNVQYSANPTAGFSVVTYTGSGALGTVTHGLGATPSMIIVKQRTASTTTDWAVYHSSLSGIPNNQLLLNSTAAALGSSTFWGNSPSSTAFSVWTSSTTNANTGTFVAYCFASVAGYSAFGSYTANGSADGPFVYTGFRPRWVMIKSTATAGTNWWVLDTARNTYNSLGEGLFPQSSAAGASTTVFDALSNGFKIRAVNADFNNGTTDVYIYAAFAENPFKYSRAR